MKDRPAPDSSLDGLLSRRLKRLRLERVLPFLPAGARVLDIGCDDGALAHRLPPATTYLGLDLRAEVIARNRQRAFPPGASFACASLDEFTWSGPPFDRVVMAAIIEHLEGFPAPLARVAGLTEPGGLLLITTPAPLAHIVLTAGARVRLFARESLHEHKGYFGRADFQGLPQWELLRYRRFELGLNQLVVLRRRPEGPPVLP